MFKRAHLFAQTNRYIEAINVQIMLQEWRLFHMSTTTASLKRSNMQETYIANWGLINVINFLQCVVMPDQRIKWPATINFKSVNTWEEKTGRFAMQLKKVKGYEFNLFKKQCSRFQSKEVTVKELALLRYQKRCAL